MEKFVRHERPFLFAPEGAVFYLSWEPPFIVGSDDFILEAEREHGAAETRRPPETPGAAPYDFTRIEIGMHVFFDTVRLSSGKCRKIAIV